MIKPSYGKLADCQGEKGIIRTCVFSHMTQKPQNFRKREKLYSSEEFTEFLG